MCELFISDPYLEPFKGSIEARLKCFAEVKARILEHESSIKEFSTGYTMFGLNRLRDRSWLFREWLPNAKSVSIFGDFNNWDRNTHQLEFEGYGRWKIAFPDMPIGSKYRLCVTTEDGRRLDRVPAWTTFAEQDHQANLFNAVVVDTLVGALESRRALDKFPDSLRIYEAHVGMSSEEYKVSTYKEFRMNVLPRVKELGYTAIQLMAVMEHAYYGSFGYHVTSFFACSSRFGSREDLMELIHAAHKMGLVVLMDLVHSHCSDSFNDGIADIDGSSGCYTLRGDHNKHPAWESCLFDYSEYETLRFLLSNVNYWITQMGFDGFRFDGVTSMLYNHHGVGVGFSGDYNEYFGQANVNMNACVYLMLANELIREIHPLGGLSIAEDVSGMPLLCRPIVPEGGFGFDFRLAMAVPDVWIKFFKEMKDEDWHMSHLVHTLMNRRQGEKCITYAESHDQSIVGDKTAMMWLMDSFIYTDMIRHKESMVADRAVALHKMVRLLTMSLGGEAYLNFMGNEFGHPEWVDFPRSGNGWSYHWSRRQWSLVDNKNLWYHVLNNFDKKMMKLDDEYKILGFSISSGSWEGYVKFYNISEHDKLIIFQKNKVIFVFNFHPHNSYADFEICVDGDYSSLCIVLNTDSIELGGHGRVDQNIKYPVTDNKVRIYSPSRTAIVFASF